MSHNGTEESGELLNGEVSPSDSAKRDGRLKIIEQFWKLADKELWPRPA